MIEAGAEALLCQLGGAITVDWSAPDLAILVYRAMVSARHSRRRQLREHSGEGQSKRPGTSDIR